MNKKLITFLAILIIVSFIGFMIYDSISPESFSDNDESSVTADPIPDSWMSEKELLIKEGSLKTVTITDDNRIILGGDSFLSCYGRDLDLIWSIKTPGAITSLSSSSDTIFASTLELILVIRNDGKTLDEWGPYESNCIITSISSNKTSVAFADAGNKRIFILDKKGEVRSLIGQNGGQFVIPSPYFDIALDEKNNIYIANTGHRRIETRIFDGTILHTFGESGTAPEAFCGCCNPAHFVLLDNGFITAEKGINRIKILDKEGDFVEYVSSDNKFINSVPLDIATDNTGKIYAANPADSKLYIYTRKL